MKENSPFADGFGVLACVVVFERRGVPLFRGGISWYYLSDSGFDSGVADSGADLHCQEMEQTQERRCI